MKSYVLPTEKWSDWGWLVALGLLQIIIILRQHSGYTVFLFHLLSYEYEYLTNLKYSLAVATAIWSYPSLFMTTICASNEYILLTAIIQISIVIMTCISIYIQLKQGKKDRNVTSHVFPTFTYDLYNLPLKLGHGYLITLYRKYWTLWLNCALIAVKQYQYNEPQTFRLLCLKPGHVISRKHAPMSTKRMKKIRK